MSNVPSESETEGCYEELGNLLHNSNSLKKRKISSFRGTRKPGPFFFYDDHSDETDDDLTTPIISFGSRMSLPYKMHVILDNSEFASIVSWMPHGRSWKIHKPEEFETIIIPQFWEKCSLQSLLRTFNCWGFLRMSKGRDKGCLYHEYFLRGMPHLCKKIKRVHKLDAEDSEIRKAKRLFEPDLYAISELHPLPPRETYRHHFDVLKAFVRDFQNDHHQHADMNVNGIADSIQKNTMESSTNILTDENTEGDLLSPLQNQLPLKEEQNEELHSTITTVEDILWRQQQLSRWQAFLLSCMQMGVGDRRTWTWLSAWWLHNGTVPLSAEEEVQPKTENWQTQDSNQVTIDNQSIALRTFLTEIMKLPPSMKSDLVEASRRCNEILGEEWQLLFLKSTNYDAKTAAQKMATYWKLRVENLGPERALLPMTIKNMFREEHIRYFNFGFVVVPGSDLCGRAIICLDAGKIHGKVYDSVIMARAFLYICHVCLDMPGTIENGVVFIINGATLKPGHANFDLMSRIPRIAVNFPFRIHQVHLCFFSSPFHRFLIPILRFFFDSSVNNIVEVHNKTGDELLEWFRVIGIPPDRLPTDIGGLHEFDPESWVADRIAEG